MVELTFKSRQSGPRVQTLKQATLLKKVLLGDEVSSVSHRSSPMVAGHQSVPLLLSLPQRPAFKSSNLVYLPGVPCASHGGPKM